MKYEEWIKYEELRKQQSDQFAWVANTDLTGNRQTSYSPRDTTANQHEQLKKNLWIVIYQRFLSRRI